MSPYMTAVPAQDLEDLARDLGGRITQRERTPDGAVLVRVTFGNGVEVTAHEDCDGNYYLN